MAATDTLSAGGPAALAMGPTMVARFARRRLVAFAVPLAILAYLVYTAFAFNLAGVAERARMDNAAILLGDFWSHKTHVTRNNRNGQLVVSVEGEAKGNYPAGLLPDWVSQQAAPPGETPAGETPPGVPPASGAQGGQITRIDLGNGHLVTYLPGGATYDVPGYGTIRIQEGADGNLVLDAPQPLPAWINASEGRISVTTEGGRFSYTRSRVETFKYKAGWPLFFFTPDSPFFGMGILELADLAVTQERLDPARSNLGFMVSEFWTNKMWRHSDVAWAMFETMLMAFIGTFGAALIALPLGFVAASNFSPSRFLRFGLRRVFDFIRGVDGLIWTIVLSRAFGPGPMTGALAMMVTDTGSFGKLFSEALENIDEKQVEGLRSTGAGAALRARFGVIPQVTPVLLSQVLYFLESNTRSATVIGAIVGGGIGLLLTQAIQTQRDWEDVAYYMVLIVLMVMAMDTFSGWLRRKLIKG